MISYIQWVLHRENHKGGHRIPVPVPNQTGTYEDPLGTPTGGPEAPFVCPECGFVTLYSRSDAGREILTTPDPYAEDRFELVYIEVGCDDKSCDSLREILAVFDVEKGNLAGTKTVSEWVIDSRVTCENGHPLRVDPAELYQPYHAWMPF
jgi:hypothetical protein